jgi:hypothetical protein
MVHWATQFIALLVEVDVWNNSISEELWTSDSSPFNGDFDLGQQEIPAATQFWLELKRNSMWSKLHKYVPTTEWSSPLSIVFDKAPGASVWYKLGIASPQNVHSKAVP